jgi:hypothetical protein
VGAVWIEVKAIVVDLDKIPPFSDSKRSMPSGLLEDAVGRLHGEELLPEDRHHGHGGFQNSLGGLPARNLARASK